MKHRLALVSLITVASSFLFPISFASQERMAWVSPAYDAAPKVDKEIIMIDHYRYRESTFAPPIMVEAVPQEQARYDIVEYSFISRVSAMMSSNYDWWLSTWDVKSRSLSLKFDKDGGRTPDTWIQQWKGIFAGARLVLVRKVISGRYVILTYTLHTLDGHSGSSLEVPAVLYEINGRWYSTLDLIRDPLVIESPWVSGKTEMEMTVR